MLLLCLQSCAKAIAFTAVATALRYRLRFPWHLAVFLLVGYLLVLVVANRARRFDHTH